MIYTIKNRKFKVDVSDKGAELQSLLFNNREYLWQGDPKFWADKALVVFPICGRLEQNKYTFKDKEYTMDIHGFACLSDFTLVKKKRHSIMFNLSSNEQTKIIYPFDFSFDIEYSIKKNTLKESIKVHNLGNQTLPFSIGGHPGFSLPFEKDAKFSDHYIEFSKPCHPVSLGLKDNGLCTGEDKPFPIENNKIFYLNEEVGKSIFLSDVPDTVTLKCKNSRKFIKMQYNDITHLGLWNEVGGDFVCIEPWHGIPSFDGKIDDFANKKHFIYLKKNKTYEFSFTITLG